MSENQVTGRCFITINGIRQRSMPGATLSFGGFARQMRVGDDSVHGYSESLAAPSVSFTLSNKADTKLQSYMDMTDVPLDFEADTGNVYRLSNATCMEPPSLTSGGDVSLRFEAKKCEEM